jgi:hypothetical protein
LGITPADDHRPLVLCPGDPRDLPHRARQGRVSRRGARRGRARLKNSTQVFAALDGELGDYLRDEMLAKGLYAFHRWFDNGFHHFTTRAKPIRTVDDLAGTGSLGSSPTLKGWRERRQLSYTLLH